MIKYQLALIRLAVIAFLLGIAQYVGASCDLQIVSAGPCLADGTSGIPHVGDQYGLRAVVNVVGTPAHPFSIVWTIANVTYTNTNITIGPGNSYSWHLAWEMDLDDTIPWSITLDPEGASGDTNLVNNTASGTFTPGPPSTAVELYSPRVWSGSESYTLAFQPGSGIIPNLYVLFGVPTSHGAQSVISVSGPTNSNYMVTPPYGAPVFEISRLNVAAATFQDTNNFIVELSRVRVNPTILRSNTWADMSTLTADWTQWLAPDQRVESTNALITSFVQQSLPPNYQATMTPYDTARSLHQTVMKTLSYLEPPPHIDAVGVLQDGIADCGGFSALLAACLRNVGIPARCISGFRQGENIPHVRVEFHLPGVEWLVADPTDGQTNDPTGTFAYDFGNASDSDRYVAVDVGDAHVLPYYTFEFIQVPNWLWFGGATFDSYSTAYSLGLTPTIVVQASPSTAGSVGGGGTYTIGANVPITASANSGWTFTGWSDGNTQNPRTISVTASGAVYTADFSLPTAVITVQANPNSGGTVTGGGTYGIGTNVQVLATANSGNAFVNWTDGGTVVSTSSTYAFTASGNRILVANFSATGGGGDLTATLTAAPPTCKTKNAVTSCKLSGLLTLLNTAASAAPPVHVRFFLSTNAAYDAGIDSPLGEATSKLIKNNKSGKLKLKATLDASPSGLFLLAVDDSGNVLASLPMP